MSATTPEITTAIATVTANWRYSAPAMPPINATGINTAHSTITIAITALETCSMDFIAACIGFRPSSRINLSTFSSTTIASSTTIPIANIMAKSVSKLMVKPSKYKPAKVPISEIGTAIIGMSVARQLCKNKNTTNTTRIKASPSVLKTSSMVAFTNSLVSYGMLYSIPSGKRSFSSSIFNLMLFAVSSALAPDCKNTPSATPGWPFNAERTL